jgi:hypothetical protein
MSVVLVKECLFGNFGGDLFMVDSYVTVSYYLDKVGNALSCTFHLHGLNLTSELLAISYRT